VVEEEVTQELADAIIAGDAARCLVAAGRAVDEGRDVRQLLRGLVEQFRDLLVVGVVAEPQGILETSDARLASLRAQSAKINPAAVTQKIKLLAAAEAEARQTTQPRIVLEMALLRAARPEMDPSLDGLAARVAALESGGISPHDAAGPAPAPKPAPEAPAAVPPAPRTRAQRPSRGEPTPDRRPESAGPSRAPEADARPTPAAAPVTQAAAESGSGTGAEAVSFEVLQTKWPRVMDEVKSQTRTVHAFLLESSPRELAGNELVLGVRHRFHMENLQDRKNRMIVEDALARVLGAPVRLRFTLDDTPAPPDVTPEEPPAAKDVLVTEAVRLFGNPVQEVRRPE
jgi:DNA polymerase-3 subunit gamma/tau